ncbi:Pif1 DNA helicase [Carabus blaptoides fortunei]
MELLEVFYTARAAFLAREPHLRQTSEKMIIYRERDRQLENAFNQIHAFEILEQESFQQDVEEKEVQEQHMNEDQFQTAQRDVFVYITQNILEQTNGSNDRLRLFINGNAGTGKTFLFNLLKNQASRCYGNPVVKLCALIGVGGRLVGSSTLDTTLKMPVRQDGRIVQMPMLTGNYLRLMRQQWKDIEFLFIDEISMQLKNSEELFGGINVLLFGDLMQLPPIRGNQVFVQPLRLAPATHLCQLFILVELKENMRQQGSTTFVDILNALRIGELRVEYFSELMSNVSKEATGEFSIEKALRIYPTNKQVQDHNQVVLEHFRAKGAAMFKIKAPEQLIHATRRTDNINIDNIIPSDINKTGGLPKELEIFVGAKIMLRSNIDVLKELVNGALGFITEVIWPNFRRAQMYETDIPSIRVDW